jgi:hypothetical protein
VKSRNVWSIALVATLASASAYGCTTEVAPDVTDDDLTDCGGVTSILGATKLKVVKEGADQFLKDPKTGRVLRDPVAKLILGSPGAAKSSCPTGFTSIQAKLKTTDPKCTPRARAVSDTSQELGVASGYRLVVTRQCSDNSRGEHEMFTSLFGIGPSGQLPEDLEMVGEERDTANKPTGVFNYYARENGGWSYFGSSVDILNGGYQTNSDGASFPKIQDQSKFRCAGCHTGGGMIMKELKSPWSKWAGDTTTPGEAEMLDKNVETTGGSAKKGTGIDMESNVRAANRDWNATRIVTLQKNLKELLRPLFCTVEMNIRTTSRQGTGGFNPPGGFLFNSSFGSSSGLSFDEATYNAGLEAVDSKLVSGGPLTKGGKVIRDTFFNFPIPEVAGATEDYLQQLTTKNLVDAELIADVNFIDFTRPVFSPTRCALLESVPTTDATAFKTAAETNAALVKAFTGKTQRGAAELLKALQAPNESATRTAAITALSTACGKRAADAADKVVLMKDVFTFASHLRASAKRLGGIIEFDPSFPKDNISESKKAFDPVSCKLTLD